MFFDLQIYEFESILSAVEGIFIFVLGHAVGGCKCMASLPVK